MSKAIHALSALVVLIAATVGFAYVPSIRKDAATALGSASAFLTVYGVIFALVELRRTRNAAELARTAATGAFNAAITTMTAREITECQAAVELALDAIDKEEKIPDRVMVRIVRLYSQVFHVEVADDKSEHRGNRTILQSYRFNSAKQTKNSVPGRTRNALMSVSGHLAQAQGTTKIQKELSA